MCALLNSLATNTLPIDGSPQLSRQVTLAENVVGDVGEFLEPHMRIELDTLGNDWRGSIVLMNIAEPNSRRNILCGVDT